MKTKLIKRILIIYILCNSNIMHNKSKQKNLHKTEYNNNKNNNHSSNLVAGRPIGMVGPQQLVGQNNSTSVQQIPNQNSFMTNPTMPNNTTMSGIPTLNTNALPTNNSITPYRPSNNYGMSVGSAQMSNNNMSITIVEYLDPIKAAQLVTDIATLKQNYQTLSTMLESSIKTHFSQNQNIKSPSQYIFNINSPMLNPTKQIINPTGNYSNAPAPTSGPVINPYTGALVTLLDIPTLTEIRQLYISNIHTLLFALGDIDANQWNVEQMKHYMGQQFQSLSVPAGQPRAYNFNSLRPIWKQATDYIQQGRLNKKHIGIRSYLKPQQNLYNLPQQTNYGEQIQQQANTPQTNNNGYIGIQTTPANNIQSVNQNINNLASNWLGVLQPQQRK